MAPSPYPANPEVDVRKLLFLLAASFTSVFTVISAAAQSAIPAAAAIDQNSAPQSTGWMLGSKVGVGVKMSPLGIGVEAATPVTYHTNVRAGFNFFGYGHGFAVDGINYDANVSFRSFETHFDWFPFSGSFHLSPGLMAYNGNRIKANAAVPGGDQFTLGGVTYTSDPADPITGSGRVEFGTVAPTILFGWGNLVPRSAKHISVPVEIGAVIEGAPKATINLTGTACNPSGLVCQNVADNVPFQNNVIAQQNKLNNDMSFLKVYPVISIGFGYKF